MADPDFLRQLDGEHLVTMDILYQNPDHPLLVQNFLHQLYDEVPKLPRMHDFIKFWEEKIEGKLVQVTYAIHNLTGPAIIRPVDIERTIH